MTRALLERPEATTRSIDDLLRDVQHGKIRIPQFQRNFRWSDKDIIKLLDSIYRGYPIGSLLFWETEQLEGSSTRFGPVYVEARAQHALLVLDGQQRLVSLVGTLLRDPERFQAEHQKFRVYFDLQKGGFETQRSNEALPRHALPLTEVANTIRYLEWLRALPSSANHDALVDAANQLVKALRDYRVPVYVVRSAGEKEVREIFERLNRGGKPLTAPEVFNAIHGRRLALGPSDLLKLGEELTALGHGEIEQRWLFKAAGALMGLDVSRDLASELGKYSEPEVQDALQRLKHAVERVLRFLRDDAGIVHLDLLPYRFPLVPLAKFFDLVAEPRAESRRRLREWLWRAACSGEHQRTDAPSIRSALALVTRDENRTTQALLNALREEPVVDISPRRHDFRAAATKLVCNGLVALRPRHLLEGTPVDIPTLVQDRGADSVLSVFSPSARLDEERRPLLNKVANRVFHPRLRSGKVSAVLKELSERAEGALLTTNADEARTILQSHGIMGNAVASLRNGDVAAFLEERDQYLRVAVADYLHERCGMDERQAEEDA